jgi:hypothetical protein
MASAILPTLSHYLALTQYYLWYWLLTLTTRCLNQGYLLNGPNRIFPRAILHPNNTTIHSFPVQGRMEEYLQDHQIQLPQNRVWISPKHILSIFPATRPPSLLITLDGTLSGPRLRPGIFAIQQGYLLYISREFGRWPAYPNLILTTAIDVRENHEFFLFVPDHLFDTTEVTDHHPVAFYNQTVSYTRFKRERRQFPVYSHDIV